MKCGLPLEAKHQLFHGILVVHDVITLGQLRQLQADMSVLKAERGYLSQQVTATATENTLLKHVCEAAWDGMGRGHDS